MDEPLRELARRDAKAIRGGMALARVALVLAVVGLFAGPFVGGLAVVAAGVVQLNVLYAWLAGPRLMAERRPVLAPGVLAGIPFAHGRLCRSSAGRRRSSPRSPPRPSRRSSSA